MPVKRILILGGTGGARRLAQRLGADGHYVVSSLAGVTANPMLPAGEIRRGGFGGTQGLSSYLREHQIEIIADATHPFAATISQHAHEAAILTGIGCVRLEQPQWSPKAGDRWVAVGDVGEAAAAIPSRARALVTIGRKELAPFTARHDIEVTARMIEPPGGELPANWRLILARPPFSVQDERDLMTEQRISVLVTKNAGGDAVSAKLQASRELSIPVIMIARPAKPDMPGAASVDGLAQIISTS